MMVTYSFDITSIEVFLLILVRIASFVFIAPFFGSATVANRIKVGLSVFIAIIMYFVVPQQKLSYISEVGYAILVLKETITGLLIGYGANICNTIILYAGNMIDMNIGLSMATMFDPNTRTEVTITGNLYQYIILALLVISNMHQYILRALVDSFTLVPLGGAIFDMNSLLTSMVKFCSDLFIIAFRITLPIFACIMIMNAILGVMAKVAPQMNMFAVGIQLKLLVGLAVMFLTIFLIPEIANFIFEEMKVMMVSFIEGMY